MIGLWPDRSPLLLHYEHRYPDSMSDGVNRRPEDEIFEELMPVRAHDKEIGVEGFDESWDGAARVAITDFYTYVVTFIAELFCVRFKSAGVFAGFAVGNTTTIHQRACCFYNVNQLIACLLATLCQCALDGDAVEVAKVYRHSNALVGRSNLDLQVARFAVRQFRCFFLSSLVDHRLKGNVYQQRECRSYSGNNKSPDHPGVVPGGCQPAFQFLNDKFDV